jgi:dTDP-4-dehydrorhamnose reductase
LTSGELPGKLNAPLAMQILLTGGSGRLGKAIIHSGLFPDILAPSSADFDICDREKIRSFFALNKITAVIHAAALARLVRAELKPSEAIDKNIIGTSNLVACVMEEQEKGKEIRFIHISTDGVYQGIDGNYKEDGPTLPQTRYGWSKLGAECAVNMLTKNFCILRTRFFEPTDIPFETAASDLYTSKITVSEIVAGIQTMLNSDYTGTINIGGEKKSDYESFKPYKADIKICSRKDIAKEVPFAVPYDISMNTSRFQKINPLFHRSIHSE